jgi:hypothetical protein
LQLTAFERDVAGNAALLALPTPGSAGSLSANAELLISGAGPQNLSISPSSSSVLEGSSLSIALSSTTLAPGSLVYWSFSGSGINAADFSTPELTGSVTLGSDRRASLSRAINLDYLDEGNEVLTVQFFSEASRSTSSALGATEITLRDVARTGVGGASDGNDVIVGTTAGEIISGVPATSSRLGRGSADVLTGGGGDDLFILGDASAVYYNDGNPSSSGAADLAAITDFSAGDRIQLRGTASDYRFATGTVMRHSGTTLYWIGPGSGYTQFGGSSAMGEVIGHLRSISPGSLSLFDPGQFIYV